MPALVILPPGEWLGEPHTGWFAVEYRGKIVALFFGEAWRVLDDGIQIAENACGVGLA